MTIRTERIETSKYRFNTPGGDFIIVRGARRYQRGDGGPGRHVTEWSIESAPDDFADAVGNITAPNKRDLIEKIQRLIASVSDAEPPKKSPPSFDDWPDTPARLQRFADLLDGWRKAQPAPPDLSDARSKIARLEKRLDEMIEIQKKQADIIDRLISRLDKRG